MQDIQLSKATMPYHSVSGRGMTRERRKEIANKITHSLTIVVGLHIVAGIAKRLQNNPANQPCMFNNKNRTKSYETQLLLSLDLKWFTTGRKLAPYMPVPCRSKRSAVWVCSRSAVEASVMSLCSVTWARPSAFTTHAPLPAASAATKLTAALTPVSARSAGRT